MHGVWAPASVRNRRTRANVVKSKDYSLTEHPTSINYRDHIEKLKKSVDDVVFLGKEISGQAINRMTNSLFKKFLGNTPPLKLVKASLLEMWEWIGTFSVYEMLNGFHLIRCEK